MGRVYYDQGMHLDFTDKEVLIATSRELCERERLHAVNKELCSKVIEAKQEGRNVYLYGGVTIDPFISRI